MGIVIDSNGVIDIAASTPGTYRITYTTAGTCPSSSTQDVTINALDNAAFSYSASSYEPTDADPTPTITGLTGGTFSGTTGLVINSTTGEIDLSASTVAAHTVTYNTSSSGSSVCPNTSTFNLAIVINQIANNYSMSFDGTNDFINVGNDSSLSPTSQLSVSAWVNNTGTGTGSFPCIISNVSSSSQNGGFTFVKTSNKWKFYLDTTGSSGWVTAESNGTVVSNSWQHLCVTWDGSTVTMYLNGQAQTTTASASQIVYNADTETIIGEYAASYFQGKIDEVAIWDTALTSTQVSEIYNATGTNTTKNLSTVAGGPVYWNRMGD